MTGFLCIRLILFKSKGIVLEGNLISDDSMQFFVSTHYYQNSSVVFETLLQLKILWIRLSIAYEKVIMDRGS